MDPAILLRYLEGRSSTEEIRAVEDWGARAAANRVELARLERLWAHSAGPAAPDFDLDAIWGRIRSRLDDPGAPPANARASEPGAVPSVERPASAQPRFHLPTASATRWRRARTIRRAALAATIVAAAVVYLLEGSATGERGPDRPMRAYATRPGEIGRVGLPDGTKAVLSGATTLRVPDDYGDDVREVFLDGEAYFEVVHDPSNVFRVRTSLMTVEDRGTRFSVLAYASDATERVAVAEGTVAVAASDTSDAVVLDPDDVAHVSAAGVVSATRDVSVDRFFSWVDGLARFEQDRLADAVKVIRRRFGIDVHIADSALAQRRFTGTVTAGTLYEDLRGLALLLDASYERDGRDVTLAPLEGARR